MPPSTASAVVKVETDLLDDLAWDGSHTIPGGPNLVGQEAIRAFFWARAGSRFPPREWEEGECTPPSSPPRSRSPQTTLSQIRRDRVTKADSHTYDTRTNA
ncbi:hypothetical protein GGX14DRAFT_578408 [Mycena pura]|uniref:Uncharacterized protein n=1 Tax=Mycena pura TaxID=153505 RepID=A0AAD6Y591_9AGAR|nr:hypothetical protein GGX14DRAFT_578408 [Mycena pura]